MCVKYSVIVEMAAAGAGGYVNHEANILAKIKSSVERIVAAINNSSAIQKKKAINIDVGRHLFHPGDKIEGLPDIDRITTIFGALYTIPRSGIRAVADPFQVIFPLPDLRFFYEKVERLYGGEVSVPNSLRHLIKKEAREAAIETLAAQYITRDIMTRLVKYSVDHIYGIFLDNNILRETINRSLSPIPLESKYLFSLGSVTKDIEPTYSIHTIEEEYYKLINPKKYNSNNSENEAPAAGRAAGGAEAAAAAPARVTTRRPLPPGYVFNNKNNSNSNQGEAAAPAPARVTTRRPLPPGYVFNNKNNSNSNQGEAAPPHVPGAGAGAGGHNIDDEGNTIMGRGLGGGRRLRRRQTKRRHMKRKLTRRRR